MAASNNDGSRSTPPLSINRTENTRPPLPLSITVRNLFPPLALSDNASTTVSNNDLIASGAVVSDNNNNGEEKEGHYDCASQSQQQHHNHNINAASSSSKQQKHQRKIKSLASKIAASSVEDRCALVSREVLLRLRLDVIAKSRYPKLACCNQDDEGAHQENASSNNNDDEEILLYSCEQSHCTAHPRWDHINEQIPNTLDANHDSYYARFVILDDHDTSSSSKDDTKSTNEWILAEIPLHPSQLRRLPTTMVNDTFDDSSSNNNSNSNRNNSMIIPHSLPPNTILLHYDDGYTRVLPNLYWLLVQKGIVTECVMDPIKRSGSGGYTTTAGHTIGGHQRFGGHQTKEEGGKSTSLFEDKAFDVLGECSMPTAAASSVTDNGSNLGNKDGVSNDISQSSLYDDDRVFDLLGKSTTGSDIHHQTTTQRNQSATKSDDSVFDDRIFDLVGATTTNTDSTDAEVVPIATENSKGGEEPELMSEETPAVESKNASETVDGMDLSKVHSELDASKEEREDRPSLTSPSSLPPSVDQLPSQPLLFTKDMAVRTAKEEVEELRRLVWKERQLLEDEQQQMNQATHRLQYTIQQVQQLEKESFEIMKAVGAERTNLFRSEFRLEAHRIHLLQQLQLIFPIKLVPINISNVSNPPNHPQHHHYTIAGLPLPDDIHNPIVTDDQVSTAVGFACHFVSLASKYLAIPLRYILVCKWSRSAILFDQGSSRDNRGYTTADTTGNNKASSSSSKVVYPLFRERGVIDREQLDFGLMLLERNVDCLLRMRGVDFRTEWNVLAKMEKLLMQMMEGEDPSFGGSAG